MSSFRESDNTLAPIHNGLYQRYIANTWLWAKWENGVWYCAHGTKTAALLEKSRSHYQHTPATAYPSWRGLAKKPDAP